MFISVIRFNYNSNDKCIHTKKSLVEDSTLCLLCKSFLLPQSLRVQPISISHSEDLRLTKRGAFKIAKNNPACSQAATLL